MTVPTISNLPTVPATSDPNFETEAPALFNHIKNTFVSEMNSAISFINSSTFDATVEFKNADFTAARNFLYMIDTSSVGISVTLPANPSTGDQLLLMDQKRTFATNNLTIVRNGQNINGAASNVVSKSTGALIRCIFQSSYGWTVDLYEGEWESGTNAGDLVYNGGNVGIGTSAPNQKLDIITGETQSSCFHIGERVNEGAYFSSTTDNALQIWAGAQLDSNAIRARATAASGMTLNNGLVVFYTDDTLTDGATYTQSERMRITSDGNVGIGTSAPKGKLDVSGVIEAGTDSSIAGSTMLRNRYVGNDYTCNFGTMQSSGAGMIGYAVAPKNGSAGFVSSADVANFARAALEVSYDLRYSTATNQSTTVGNDVALDTKFIVKNDGKVGIGTSEPSAKLEIAGDKDATNLIVGAPLHTVNGGGLANSSQLLFDNNYTTGTSGTAYIRHYANSHQNSEGALFFGTTSSTGTTSSALVIRGDGNVGIGVGSPARKLTLYQSDSDGSFLQFANQTTGALITDGSHVGINNSEDLEIAQLETGKQIQFWNGGTRRLVIDSAGDVEVKTGNLVIGTAGKGIDFSANSHATGMSSELFDSYEEGTWSPVVADASSGGNTATGNFSGTYTKVGRVVTVHGYVINVNTTGLTSTNDLFIRGLPFNNRDTIARYGTVRVQAVNFSGYCVVQLGGNANFFTILENISGSTNDVITVADLTSGTADILFSLTYEA